MVRRILVTRGDGFVGSHLGQELLSASKNVRIHTLWPAETRLAVCGLAPAWRRVSA